MNSTDIIYRATACGEQFRIFAVDSTKTVQTTRDLHDLSPLATVMIGRLISATAMMGIELKSPKSNVSINLNCDGPLHGAIVVYEHGGFIRAYAKNPSLFFDEVADNYLLAKHIGTGTLTIIRDIGTGTPFNGISEIVSGEIGEDIANYYLQSEQIPTAVSLGVLFDNNAKVRASGGYIIQQMPHADPKLADQIIDNINKTPHITDLMDMGYSIIDILDKFVLKDLDWNVTKEQSIEFRCNCSKDRFEKALITLGYAELNEMKEGISPVCSYCNQEYKFDTADMEHLLSLFES
ncbi:MAG: Hsp33 family molecular chaperone HslO [Candidatus Cloacimonetes bacterium HGW-Cloacimonetes-1]|jgi:molecular chaperone Hsp33|nr:MAG: Hsp33 family molecular chaperone HslO [Candidatus Cloacimonetes bacterium HGW-Cloacimonetes-1]